MSKLVILGSGAAPGVPSVTEAGALAIQLIAKTIDSAPELI